MLKITMSILLFLFACQSSPANPNESANDKTNVNKNSNSISTDKDQLTTLIRELYEWFETKAGKFDFEPKKGEVQDSQYVGIDWDAHVKRIKELEATGFFSNEFINNYNQIAKTIDSDVKHGIRKWYVGDIPPFGGDINPWCRCQDYPYDDYWKDIKLTNLVIKGKNATFKWKWGREWDGEYKIGVIKVKNVWKISYMQGFEAKLFLADY